jgi:anti-anti-sigma factor
MQGLRLHAPSKTATIQAPGDYLLQPSEEVMAKLDQNDRDGVRVLQISGSLNQHGVDTVESAFNKATGSFGRLVVDLSQVDLVNTPALAMFLGAHRSIKQSGGRLVFTGVQGMVDDLLRRCRLDTVLTIVPEMREALEWAKQ